jgi:hypothetical protein
LQRRCSRSNPRRRQYLRANTRSHAAQRSTALADNNSQSYSGFSTGRERRLRMCSTNPSAANAAAAMAVAPTMVHRTNPDRERHPRHGSVLLASATAPRCSARSQQCCCDVIARPAAADAGVASDARVGAHRHAHARAGRPNNGT